MPETYSFQLFIISSERTEAALAQKVEWVRQAAGARFDALELNLLVSLVAITDDRRKTAAHYIREWELTNATPERLLQNPYLLIGSVEQIIEDIQVKRSRFGISYFVVFDEHMEAFAPVVERLASR